MKRRLSIACLLLVALPAVADEVARLHSIFDNSWERRLRENPLFATSVGRHEYDDRLPSVTPQDLALRQAERKATREVLASIDRSKLPMAEQVNYDIFLRQIDEGIESYDLGDYQMPINADSGFHTGFSRLPKEVPLATVKDYQNYISRLGQWPRYVGEQIALMRLGLKSGMTVPRATLTGYEKSISAHVVDGPEKSVFWEPFKKFP